ncbi:uncharacterized protein [Rutidosis leptorrhynchoides]|uniref:uncharacterized protein n=1 Tax=Rutidosis leptorrhynchoides TaxID=125765 RepID=UPI003A99E584
MLITNVDVFSWSKEDMTGLLHEISEHKLNASPSLTLVRQKKRPMAPKRNEWLRMKVEKPVNANILRESLKSRKEVQSLTGKLAALTRFLSKAVERSLPFFQTLKNSLKKSDFKWIEEDEKAFLEMKALLKELPTLTATVARETLMMYLATSKEAKSSVLVVDRGQVQMHVYFVSNTLSGSEVNYTPIEKLVYVLVRLAKWAIELREHEINFSPQTAVKGQILAYYLTETAVEIEASKESIATEPLESQSWELYTDGACGPKGSGAGLVLTSPEGEEHIYVFRFAFTATNNELEYEALLSGMRIVQQLGIKYLDAYVDSQLVANQVNGLFEAHDASMQSYLELKSIDEKSTIVSIEEESPNWMTLILKFLVEGMLPIDEKEARKVHMKAPMYTLVDGGLYRKLFLGPSLLCIGPNQAKEVPREVHEGYCALHSDYWTIAAKVIRIGYYWPTIHKYATEVVRTCQSCQQHVPISRAPRHPMIILTAAWPFCKWAIDIVGPITACSGGIKFLVVAIDYFTSGGEGIGKNY